MSKGRIWLGNEGAEVLLSNIGRSFTEEDIEITRENTTASGKLVIDVIRVKKRFIIEYSRTTNEVMETLKSIYEIGGILSLKVERYDGTVDTYKVKMRPFSRRRIIMATKWFWENISIELEEV